ncbi:lamin tail domain-containing protein [Haloferula sp. BvORR071]|uniref:lamin tail domain-containing protein n=1 Tax=Haloferula sp. BvORR071 TaxID=1396141 RepID=UPI002240EFCA|nr:lamin tail domain-containing protein [Haloferula sp. BvORR071]
MQKPLRLLGLPLLLLLPAAANPVITEFMASNQATIADEDGTFADWIEVHNPDPTPVSLDQWCLTDNAAVPNKWVFPAVTLAPGEFKIVWASSKNRRVPSAPLHTNFSLSADGEYLALVRPDGTVEQSFGPAFPAQRGDESYGAQFNRTTLLAPGVPFRYQAPASAEIPGAAWNQPGFADSGWSLGNSGFGHGITVPGITVRQVFRSSFFNTLADADALLALPAGNPAILSDTTVTAEVANYLGEGGDGHFGENSSPPGGSGDAYAIKLTGFVEIPTAGVYTFGTNTDDGVRIRIDGSNLVVDDSNHGPLDMMGSRSLSAGPHSFEVVMFQGNGGSCLEFFAAAGSYTAFNANFRLVGDTANGGLAATTLPQGAGGLIGTNTQSLFSGRADAYFRGSFNATGPGSFSALSLVTHHNDGFVAWLNGTQVASHNAPANPAFDSVALSSRTNEESLRPVAFNLTSQLPALINGGNLLAIQGIKSSIADSSFLLTPELYAGSLIPGSAFAFYREGKPTPGWINGTPSSLGKIQNLSFSAGRGFYTAPVAVTLSSATPGVTIRYTTDGSTPSATTGFVYGAPLNISATTTLRAIAVKTGWESTEIGTQTYLFLNDVITQPAAPAGWPTTSGTSQVLNYGMDPDIVNNGNPDIGGAASTKAALAALPSVSIVTDLPNLFNINGSQGIYSNPNSRGFAWERPASLEWISPPDAQHPNGKSEFQINAGLRLRGGYSRSTDNPKHSFRFFFRSDYGDGKLTYPLFGHHGAQEFDKIDFRTAQNYSWSFGGDDRNTFLREESTRQTQLDMGQPGSHVRYFHLYLNGQYWGLYDLDERTEAAFAETYMGGDKDKWDVMKAEQEADYVLGATDGTFDAWQDLWNKTKAHRASPTNANYFRLMGKAADGVTPNGEPVLLDTDNLIDYLMLTFWSGNLDGCTSEFLGNNKANNWFASRRRVGNPGEGFRFFAHDFEHTFLDVNTDRTGPYNFPSDEANFARSNPLYFHQDLTANAEYRMRWADRIQKHMFNGGALEPASWSNRVNKLAADVDASIIAESARWGDASSAAPKTRQTWINAQNSLLAFHQPRAAVVLNQLRNDGLYPTLDAPTIAPFGGYQASGVEAVIGAPGGGTLYYMPDGSDPRAVGGAVRGGAQIYTPAVTTQNLVPWSASGWRYLANGQDQGVSWRTPAFNDAGWATGIAELGYGDGDEATVIPIVFASAGQKVATGYFRKSFTVADLAGITSLSLNVEYDDAYAVYLNGSRIAGDLPVDPAYNYYSGNAIEDQTTGPITIPKSFLLEGNNVLAVEIHQASGGSSDMSMNCSLTATRSATVSPLFVSGGGERPLRVRALSGATWSAMTEAQFLLDTDPASPANLAISEILYHPLEPTNAETAAGFADADDFEFIELVNTSSRYVDLQGVYFYGAVNFEFSNATTGRTLAPGARVLVVGNKDAFAMRYGSGKPVAGAFTGKLDNAGENLVLYTPGEAVLRSVNYDDAPPWPVEADGEGYSLVRRHPNDPASDSNGDEWAASGSLGGSPGEADVPSVGSFSAWAAANFTPEEQANVSISAVAADPDGDGRPNFEEFAFATNPMVKDKPATEFVWLSFGQQHLPGLKLRCPQVAQGIHYELLASDDLGATWTTVAELPELTEGIGGGLQMATYADPAANGATKRFLRMRATWGE